MTETFTRMVSTFFAGLPTRKLAVVGVFLAMTVSSVTVSAKESLAQFGYGDLEYRLAQAKLFEALVQSKNSLDKQPNCGRYFKAAGGARKALINLNKQYASNPTAQYRREAIRLKQDNADELRRYKQCFSNLLPNHRKVTAAGITTYEIHRERYRELENIFGDAETIRSEISNIEKEIRELGLATGTGAMASIMLAGGDLEILRGGNGTNWSSARQNMLIERLDRVRTGANSTAQIRLRDADRENGQSAQGSTIILGSGTEIEMSQFQVTSTGKRPTRSATIDLDRGMLRIISPRFGIGSGLTIRSTSTSMKLANGDAIVRNVADRNTVEHRLISGEAAVEVNGVDTPISAGQAVAVSAGALLPPRTMASNELDQLMSVMALSGPNNKKVSDQTTANNLRLAYVPVTGPKTGLSSLPPLERTRSQLTSREELDHGLARFYAAEYLYALKNTDTEKLLGLMGQKLRETYNSLLQKSNLEQVLETNGNRPQAFRIRCSACVKQKGGCAVLVDVEYDSDRFSSPQSVFVSLNGVPTKVISSTFFDEQRMSRFRTIGPVCGKLPRDP